MSPDNFCIKAGAYSGCKKGLPLQEHCPQLEAPALGVSNHCDEWFGGKGSRYRLANDH